MAKTLVYQLYPLSWVNFERMTQHLARIEALGADYVWLSPVYPSPLHDHGYDISNYMAINHTLGDMEDFDRFVEEANKRGIKVLMDLVLNHTSTRHSWFCKKPEYYIWESSVQPGCDDVVLHSDWHNLFDGRSTWKYEQKRDACYLHLFHAEQADLNWFPDGHNINTALVQEFQQIVDFWIKKHGVSGFRLDVPQSINKDFGAKTMEFRDLLDGDKSIEVINAIFPGPDTPFLMVECFDPSFGEITKKYTEETSANFVLNVLLKDQISEGESKFLRLISRQSRNPRFMLDLESHDSPRFPSRENATLENMVWCMFNSDAKGICLYQGQELGLSNPNKRQLPDVRMLKLDAWTAMRYARGERLSDLRPTSRANARLLIHPKEYEKQEADPGSYLHLVRWWINHWKNS